MKKSTVVRLFEIVGVLIILIGIFCVLALFGKLEENGILMAISVIVSSVLFGLIFVGISVIIDKLDLNARMIRRLLKHLDSDDD